MGEILGNDAGARLVFLRDVMIITVRVICRWWFAGNVFQVGRAGDLDLGATELGVVKQEGGLGGAEEQSVLTMSVGRVGGPTSPSQRLLSRFGSCLRHWMPV